MIQSLKAAVGITRDQSGSLIARIESLQTELARFSKGFSPLGFRPNLHPAVASDVETRVRCILKLRSIRRTIFDKELFGEPAWDMLLELYVLKLNRRNETVSGLCIASGAPSTTALRWIKLLEQLGWIERSADAKDRRRIFVALTAKAESAMEAFFALPEANF